MATLRYTVPSRIHGTLLQMSDTYPFVDGGFGFSLNYPRLVFTAQQEDTLSFSSADSLPQELSDVVMASLKRLQEKCNLGGAHFTFEETIPLHTGFGSKTATLLSTGHALAKLYDLNLDFRDLGVFLGRGGTSGVGIHAIDKGGFVVDGGHPKTEKAYFSPSSTSVVSTPPLLITQMDMPLWDILLVVPAVEKRVYGCDEVSFFQRVCPIPKKDVDSLVAITFSLLHAVAYHDLSVFCQGINAVQKKTLKRSEIAEHDTVVYDTMQILKQQGAQGVGMSSLGPCVYAFGEHRLLEQIAYECSLQIPEKYSFVKLTKPNNAGLKIEYI